MFFVQQQQQQHQQPYKKGQQHILLNDPSVKCDDLILYSDNYPYGLGCTVCNYAPNSLRYLRDHIRKVHLARTYKCTYCERKTKRRADLMRHIKRMHEDPKRAAAAVATAATAATATTTTAAAAATTSRPFS